MQHIDMVPCSSCTLIHIPLTIVKRTMQFLSTGCHNRITHGHGMRQARDAFHQDIGNTKRVADAISFFPLLFQGKNVQKIGQLLFTLHRLT